MCGNLDCQKTTYEKRYIKRREKHDDLDDNKKEHAEKGNNKRKKVR